MDKSFKMIKYYPVALNLKGETAVVVGGGPVAERKILNLLRTGADISVVSPRVTLRLRQLFGQGKLRWRACRVQKDDLKKAKIVIAATSDRKINRDVSKWAKQFKGIVNVVDNKNLSTFISPAVLYNKQAIIAVYTDGQNPVLSRDLKNFLKEHWREFLSYRRKLRKNSR